MISNRLRIPIRPPSERYQRLISAEEAQLAPEVSPDGTLHLKKWGRSWTPTFGYSSAQGRLFAIRYVLRYWEDYYADGELMIYAVTMLTLLAQPDVNLVWYMSDYNIDDGEIPCRNRADVHQLIDDYVRVGNKMHARPTKFIYAEGSDTIVEV